MFDNIANLKTANKDSLIDIGLVAESLLFYEKVHLLLTRGTLHSLLNDLQEKRYCTNGNTAASIAMTASRFSSNMCQRG
jgi:hypothetical protein